MQAIQTKDLRPTTAHGARIRVKCAAGSITVAHDHEVGHEANHRAAAQKLVEKLEWTGEHYGRLVCGQLPDGTYVHVFTVDAK